MRIYVLLIYNSQEQAKFLLKIVIFQEMASTVANCIKTFIWNNR